MSDTTMMSLLGTGTAGTILSLAYMFYKAFKGKKCKSRCCNRDIEMGFDVGNMTPIDSPQEFSVVNPLPRPEK